MSNSNNNNNKNDNKNKKTLDYKKIFDLSLNNIKLPPIDNSNNKIYDYFYRNELSNHNLFSLESCKEKKYILSKNSKEIIKKNQLNINNISNNNMTINKVIENIKSRREKNNKERLSKYKDFIKELDEKEKREKLLLLEDKKKEEKMSNDLKDILDILNKKVGDLEKTSTLFSSKDDISLFPIGRHRRKVVFIFLQNILKNQ